jgi:hypothetical protein
VDSSSGQKLPSRSWGSRGNVNPLRGDQLLRGGVSLAGIFPNEFIHRVLHGIFQNGAGSPLWPRVPGNITMKPSRRDASY